MEIFPGTRVKVFDHLLFKDDFSTPISVTVRPATVIRRYEYISPFGLGNYPDVVDVIFDHRPNKVSRAHFTEYVEVI